MRNDWEKTYERHERRTHDIALTFDKRREKVLFLFLNSQHSQSRRRNIFCLFWRWHVCPRKPPSNPLACERRRFFTYFDMRFYWKISFDNFGRWQMATQWDQIWCDGGTIINIVSSADHRIETFLIAYPFIKQYMLTRCSFIGTCARFTQTRIQWIWTWTAYGRQSTAQLHNKKDKQS